MPLYCRKQFFDKSSHSISGLSFRFNVKKYRKKSVDSFRKRKFATIGTEKEASNFDIENPDDVVPVTRRVIFGLGNPGTNYDGTRHNIGFDILDNIASNFLPVFSPGSSSSKEMDRVGNDNAIDFSELPSVSSLILEKNVHFMKGITRGFNNKLVDHDLTDSVSVRRQRRTDEEGVKYPVVALTLVKPTTYMNRSGTAVMQLIAEKKIQLKSNSKSMNYMDDILIIYDDVELPFGSIRLLPKGGHGGHNGMRDIVNRLSGQNVPRLRIGIKQQGIDMSAKFVLSKFDSEEQQTMQDLKDFVAAIVRVYIHRGFDAASHFNKMTVFDFQKHREKRKRQLLKQIKKKEK